MYHFDEGIERKHTNCDKWDAEFIGENVLPMWVADMDFEVAPAITKRLEKAAKRGAFGYQFLSDAYYDAVINFMKERHDYEVKKEWICYIPNVVLGIFHALQAVTEPGDEVMVHTPAYGSFFRAVKESGRVLKESQLRNEKEYYTMDFEEMESLVTKKTKALILCNPHNPSGRVWKEEELRNLVKFCAKHELCIISDDIHCDIISKEHKHTMAAPICREYGVDCITFTSPSKPFNLASIHVANVMIEDGAIRDRFQKLLAVYHVNECNAFTEEALIGAYEESREWLDRMNEYVEQNIRCFVEGIQQNIPVLQVHKPEGTYLVWVDFSKADLKEDVKEYLHKKCKLLVGEGKAFGSAGKDHARFNLACPRKYVEKALNILIENFSTR